MVYSVIFIPVNYMYFSCICLWTHINGQINAYLHDADVCNLKLSFCSGELEIELERRKKIELRSVELDKALKKPKATEFELRQLERGL